MRVFEAFFAIYSGKYLYLRLYLFYLTQRQVHATHHPTRPADKSPCPGTPITAATRCCARVPDNLGIRPSFCEYAQ